MTPWRAVAGVEGKGKGALEELMRERIRATIETIVDEELEAALGVCPIATSWPGSSWLPARKAPANADGQP
jgi:hypothetical protein